MPAVAATPGNVWPKAAPPNHAILASCGCVAQNPCVRVTPCPVFSNTQFTVSPFLRLTLTVWVCKLPVPVLPPLPVTVQSSGLALEPPMPVSTHPSGTISLAV